MAVRGIVLNSSRPAVRDYDYKPAVSMRKITAMPTATRSVLSRRLALAI
jgi:hypothetical protein